MLVVLPFYFGLAATAEPFVLAVLGPKWARGRAAGAGARHGDAADDAADPVRAGDQRARPAGARGAHRASSARCSCPLAFLIGLQWGVIGLAWAWLAGMAVLLAATVELSRPVLEIGRRQLLGAVAPGFAASGVMAGIVWAADALAAAARRGAAGSPRSSASAWPLMRGC